MQITDLVNQYQNMLGAGTKVQPREKGVEKLVSAVSSLIEGQIFEGTVNAVKGQQVLLGLSSGQNISARLDKGVQISQGQSVFFQVKSNDGKTVNIRPVSIGGQMNNPALQQALRAASIPMTEASIGMVDEMMKRNMPIDVKSLSEMAKQLALHPEADVKTLVALKDLEIPINGEMISQYENYKQNEGEILRGVSQLTGAISEVIGAEGTPLSETAAFLGNLSELLYPGEGYGESGALPTNMKGQPLLQAQEMGQPGAEDVQIRLPDGRVADGSVFQGQAEAGAAGEAGALQQADAGFSGQSEAAFAGQGEAAAFAGQGEAAGTPGTMVEEPLSSPLQAAEMKETSDYEPGTLGRMVSEENLRSLEQALRELPEFAAKHDRIFDARGRLDRSLPAKELFFALTEGAQQNLDGGKLKEITGHKAVRDLLEGLLEERFTIEPRELTEKGKVDDLYNKINKDMHSIAQAANDLPNFQQPVKEAAGNVQNNLEFINQVNEMYSYIQIPVRLTGQNATGELYVYQNKKKHAKGENEEVSAFLHFDLEHLGSTDIAVKLRNKKVKTEFFMDDDRSYRLVENNIHILQAKLESLGYDCQITVGKDDRKVDFVEDFLKQDSGANKQNVLRYSFDMKA